jgi:TPR repeat protein
VLLACLFAASPAFAQTISPGDLAALTARAESGDPESLNNLGNLYANGRGVPRNDAEALRYYTRAAGSNYAPAFFNLGMMHELGRGVPADAAKAFGFYRQAAELGFALGQFNMYGNGIGVKADPLEAVLWFRQAAEIRGWLKRNLISVWPMKRAAGSVRM